jgi:conjugal transfer pilus assembly protein TraW
MLEEIEALLREKERSGELARLAEEGRQRSMQSAESPIAVAGMEPATVARTWYWDPSYRVPQTYSTPDGQVFARAGDVFNPLEFLNFSKRLVFIDGRSEAQVQWAKDVLRSKGLPVKIILVAGRPLELGRQWHSPVYFDQGGAIVRRLGLRRVPAVVSQEGKRLRVDEVAL